MSSTNKSILLKTVLAGTTALAIAGTTLAYADQGSARRDRAEHWRPNAQDVAAFGDARIAALHAGLKLTPEQEKNWPAVETALKDMVKQRSDRFAARASADKPTNPLERMNQRASAMTERGQTLKKFAEAAGPLYSSLDDGQKHRFAVLARLADGQGFGRGHRGHHDWQHHRGPHGTERGPMGPNGGNQPQ